jgi:hypothetical protein
VRLPHIGTEVNPCLFEPVSEELSFNVLPPSSCGGSKMKVLVGRNGSQLGCKMDGPGVRADDNQVAVEERVKVSPHECTAAQ